MIVPGWTNDLNDSSGGPYTSIGHATSGGCSTSGGDLSPDISIAAIGMSNAPTYTMYSQAATVSGYAVDVRYTVSSANTFVVLLGACGKGNVCSAGLTSGCTEKQSITGGDNFESVYLATCQSQSVGTYDFGYSTRPPSQMLRFTKPIIAAAYVFPDYTPIGA